MQLTKSQNKVVSQLFNFYLKRDEYKFTSFKAPTGSGKTFMASELISRIFSEEFGKNRKTIVVFATVSNAELPKQLAKKLNVYKKFHQFNNYKIEFIYSPSAAKSNKVEDIREFNLEDNKVFVFGTSSFGKNTLFYQNKTLENFIQQSHNENYQIIFIRDEAHIGGKKELSKDILKNFDDKVKEAANFIVEMTATPKNAINFVELTLDDIKEDNVNLLKEEQILPNDLLFETNNEELIDHAIKVFKESKKNYQNIDIENFIINPAMLVQIMNESDYEKDPKKSQDFQEGLKLLERKLQLAGLKYLKYLNSNPEVIGANLPATLEYASELDSYIDVIIFKVGPATGWDIPRANMLLQLRNVSSESLNIQTIGRIMRNPIPSLEKNEITNKYYLYSNYQKPTRELANYFLEKKFKDKNLYVGKIDQKSRRIISDNNSYRDEVINFIKTEDFIKNLKNLYPDQIIYGNTNYITTTMSHPIANYVDLKIYNIKKWQDLEESFKVSLFNECLREISNKNNINIEKTKYFFTNSNNISKLQEIKNKYSDWIHDEQPYVIKKEAKLLPNYSIWIDNNNFKKVDTSNIENYGYFLITNEENKRNEKIQYLDSTPELNFFQEFKKRIKPEKWKEIKFFAKMPTLGSGVYFEYYSKIEATIKKSFMDFAIEYKDRVIMVEVKSKYADYDIEKTNDLINAYKMYMKKYSEKNLSLVLYKYGENDTELHLMIDGEWTKDITFEGALQNLFD